MYLVLSSTLQDCEVPQVKPSVALGVSSTSRWPRESTSAQDQSSRPPPPPPGLYIELLAVLDQNPGGILPPPWLLSAEHCLGDHPPWKYNKVFSLACFKFLSLCSILIAWTNQINKTYWYSNHEWNVGHEKRQVIHYRKLAGGFLAWVIMISYVV